MVLDREAIKKLFLGAAKVWKENADRLSEIDSRFGDGDHGVTIGKIAALMEKEAAAWEDGSIHDFIDGLGMDIMGVNGGSAGPLYGTMVSGLASPLGEETEVDAVILKEMLAGCLSEMEDITTAKVGDKTMMDALIPAVEAAKAAPDEVEAILAAAAKAAQEGAKASEGFVSKFGRARSYKEQTIGTPDAGAVSTALFFAGLAAAIQ